MSSPLTGVDAWVGTARSIRWSPFVLPPVAGAASLLALGVLVDADPTRIGSVAETGLAFAAATAAFIIDDPANDAAPGTPVDARARLAARVGLMAPVAMVGWLLVLGTYVGVAPGFPVELGRRTLTGVGMASAALALAAIVSRFRSTAPAGGAGVGVMAGLAFTLQVLPVRWLEHLPPARAVCPLAIVVALVVVVHVTREPTSS